MVITATTTTAIIIITTSTPITTATIIVIISTTIIVTITTPAPFLQLDWPIVAPVLGIEVCYLVSPAKVVLEPVKITRIKVISRPTYLRLRLQPHLDATNHQHDVVVM